MNSKLEIIRYEAVVAYLKALFPYSPLRILRTPRETSVRTDGIPAKNRTGHLPNTRQKVCREVYWICRSRLKLGVAQTSEYVRVDGLTTVTVRYSGL
jgi:hypothetical protein